ncbi:dolichyl-phosphate beta-glucosyltransferase, variant 3 [Aspergillus fumigatus]
MAGESWIGTCVHCTKLLASVPLSVLLAAISATLLGSFVLFYVVLYLVAPEPRKPLPEEKRYRTLSEDGAVTQPEQLPCWQDALDRQKRPGRIFDHSHMEKAELFMSLVVPAYNEEDRLAGMLEEAVNYLERMYGTLAASSASNEKAGDAVRQRKPTNGYANGHATTMVTPSGKVPPEKGWEIIIVSDGSKDKTEEVAFAFARDHQLSLHPKGYAGPWTPTPHEGVHIPPGTIRVVTLAENRGKGGAVTHGMRHVRGQYVVFADADGASNFEDLGKLVTACRDIEDSDGRGVAVGSRAHMVGSEAVVKVRFVVPVSLNWARLTSVTNHSVRNYVIS